MNKILPGVLIFQNLKLVKGKNIFCKQPLRFNVAKEMKFSENEVFRRCTFILRSLSLSDCQDWGGLFAKKTFGKKTENRMCVALA